MMVKDESKIPTMTAPAPVPVAEKPKRKDYRNIKIKRLEADIRLLVEQLDAQKEITHELRRDNEQLKN